MFTEKKTILLVEDQIFISMRLVQLMRAWGYSSLTASSGEIAIACAQTAKLDLILMDIDLGAGMDGADTAREILKSRNLPIVFHTSYPDVDVQSKIQGIAHYGSIQKSVSDLELKAMVDAALQRFETLELQN